MLLLWVQQMLYNVIETPLFDAHRDVIVARCDVRRQWAQGIERGFIAPLGLLPHVLRDLVQGHVAWPLVHHLRAQQQHIIKAQSVHRPA